MNDKDYLNLVLQNIDMSKVKINDFQPTYIKVIKWHKDIQILVGKGINEASKLIVIIDKPSKEKLIKFFDVLNFKTVTTPKYTNILVLTPENSIDYLYIHYPISITYNNTPYFKCRSVAQRLIKQKEHVKEVFKNTILDNLPIAHKYQLKYRYIKTIKFINEELKCYKNSYPEYII